MKAKILLLLVQEPFYSRWVRGLKEGLLQETIQAPRLIDYGALIENTAVQLII